MAASRCSSAGVGVHGKGDDATPTQTYFVSMKISMSSNRGLKFRRDSMPLGLEAPRSLSGMATTAGLTPSSTLIRTSSGGEPRINWRVN